MNLIENIKEGLRAVQRRPDLLLSMNDSAPDDPSNVPTALGDYTDIRPFSEGGHGRFYLATPPARLGLTEPVVIKVVAGAQEAGFRRFTGLSHIR